MKKVHFIGIGGIGVSALARFYLAKGWQVSGSDLAESEITKTLLQGLRHPVIIGHEAVNVPDNVDKVIYSAAVKPGNPEMVRARDLGVPVLSYAEALGELTKEYFTLAVSGSHGKSTTTALLSLMLIKAGLDPTIIIGTRLREFEGTNFRLGQSNYLVIEADEWNNSFHYYNPQIVALTNVDKEHLDTHKNLAGVIKNFGIYLNRVPDDGYVIVNAQDKNSLQAIKNCSAKIIFYNKFEIKNLKSKISWHLQIPGEFNQLNCEAAWQAAQLVGVSKKIAQQAVKNYLGSWRRMEYLVPRPTVILTPARELGEESFRLCRRSTYISDYAHHPSEIKATGQALKEKYGDRKLVVIFQPHQVERLTNLFKEFTTAFESFDVVGILPAYEVSGRERFSVIARSERPLVIARSERPLVIARSERPLVIASERRERGNLKNAKDLAQKIKANYLNNFTKALDLVREVRKSSSKKLPVFVFMGAGDIDNDVRKYFKSRLFDE